MKPECHRVVERIAALSADDLSPAEAEMVRRHLEQCPPCKGQWVLFERTLVTLDRTPQPLLSPQRSRQMWLVCLEHARAHQSGGRKLQVDPDPEAPSAPRGRTLWENLGKSFGWAAVTPRLGWALAGGAASLLVAAYVLAPQQAQMDAAVHMAAAPLPRTDFGQFTVPRQGQIFEVPSPGAAQLVDYHTSMAFEPYSDHVGHALVAYSVSAPPARFTVPNVRHARTQP